MLADKNIVLVRGTQLNYEMCEETMEDDPPTMYTTVPEMGIDHDISDQRSQSRSLKESL